MSSSPLYSIAHPSRPYGNLNWKPMSPQTRIHVKIARGTQLFLRACALISAIGLLICVICLKGTDNTLGWIIRVAVCLRMGMSSANPSAWRCHSSYGICDIPPSSFQEPHALIERQLPSLRRRGGCYPRSVLRLFDSDLSRSKHHSNGSGGPLDHTLPR